MQVQLRTAATPHTQPRHRAGHLLEIPGEVLAAAGLPAAEELTLTAADGERLVAWTVPPRSGKPVILYFHGNAGHIGSPGRVARFRALTEDGTGLLAVSYRGYGGSTVVVDTDKRLCVSYVMNRMEPGALGDPRGFSLLQAAYASLAG